MTKLVTIDQDSNPNTESCEAEGHPTECTEVVSGKVTRSDDHNVTVNDADGNEKPLATRADTLHFDSHSHDYSSEDGCHEDSSHDITDDSEGFSNLSSSITINDEPVMVVADGVSTDPGSGGAVNVTGSGINNSLNESDP